jgi:hypothetical protein
MNTPLKYFIILFFLESVNASAQNVDFNYINSKSSGLIIGSSFIDEHLPEGFNYHPIKFIYNYSIPMLRYKMERKSNFFIQFEPQFNPVIIAHSKNAFEFGVNVGFLYHLKLSDQEIVFGGIGSGPHYISVTTTMQSKGFIFSDNFIIGYRRLINLKKPLELNLQIRFRHISNASLQQPNHGIDNFFILIGLSKVIAHI